MNGQCYKRVETKFKVNDEVYSSFHQDLGLGIIKCFHIENLHIYLGSNEWNIDKTTYATVAFNDLNRSILLKNLISKEKIDSYHSLKKGDLVIYSRQKLCCVVIDVKFENKSNIIKNVVYILKKGEIYVLDPFYPSFVKYNIESND